MRPSGYQPKITKRIFSFGTVIYAGWTISLKSSPARVLLGYFLPAGVIVGLPHDVISKYDLHHVIKRGKSTGKRQGMSDAKKKLWKLSEEAAIHLTRLLLEKVKRTGGPKGSDHDLHLITRPD